jgi:hypothetical protein
VYSAKVKNEWSSSTASPYAFIIYTGTPSVYFDYILLIMIYYAINNGLSVYFDV